MKRIYSSQNRFTVGRIKAVLDNEKIICFVKNEFLSGAMGEIPPIECWLEIWVARDSQYERALKVLEAHLSNEGATGPDWTCLRCGETHEHQFSECWNCGTSQPKQSA